GVFKPGRPLPDGTRPVVAGAKSLLAGRQPVTFNANELSALCAGVSRYADPALNLKFAADDATEMARRLSAQRLLYRDARVTCLVDEHATGAAVRTALATIQREATDADTVIRFLSGHGMEDAEGNYYFGTHEADLKALPQTTLTAAQLQ